MFWKFGFHTPSAIDGILARDDFTLEDLLDDDDVLQECRNQNKELTDFLSKEEVVVQMLQYVTSEPPGSPDDRQRFRYPNVASELLTTDTPGILDAVCATESLDLIWGILDSPAPLNPLLASYFTKITFMLLNKRPELITGYIYSKHELFNKLVSHLGTSAIMDLLRRMTSIEQGYGGVPFMQWLAKDKQLVAILVSLFEVAESGADDMILTNAATLIQDLISDGRKEAIELQEFASPSPFLNQIESREYLTELLNYVLRSGSALALDRGLPIVLALLDDPVRGEEEAPPSEMDIARHVDEVKNIMQSLVPFLVDVHALLEQEPPLDSANEGEEPRKRLGKARLNAAHVIEAMVVASCSSIEDELIRLGTVPKLLEYFEQFPENNFIHKHVAAIVGCITARYPTETDKAPLFKHLFVDCKVLEVIERTFRTSLAAEEGPKGRPLGYKGHVVKIATDICEIAKDCDPVEMFFPTGDAANPAMVEAREAWENFRTNELEEVRKSWRTQLGGKPPHMMPDSDDDDDDMLYTGGQGADLAFSQYLGQRISVELPNDLNFDDDDDSSSSDDDEDEGNRGAVDLVSGEASGTLFSQFGGSGAMGDYVEPTVPTDGVPEENLDWQVKGAEGDAPVAADPAGEANAAESDKPKSPVAPLDLATDSPMEDVGAAAPAGDPFASSTPIDAAPPAGNDWAQFETAAPADASAPAEPTPASGSNEALATETGEAEHGADTTADVDETEKDGAEAASSEPGGAGEGKAGAPVEIEGGGNLFGSSA